MIKGVQRQIIEVNDTGNPYFERALLIVRPGYTEETHGERVREEARRLLRQADGYTGLRYSQRIRRLRRIRVALFSSAAGMAVGGLLVYLLLH